MNAMSSSEMPIGTREPAATGTAFRESFEGFYQRESKAVVGLAFVLSGSRAGAEDLAQEGFLAAYRHWDRISSYDDPGAWVRRVVANRAISGFRRAGVEARAMIRMQVRQIPFPDLPAETEELWHEVRRLPTRQAQVIALRYLDRKSIADIASILECSENTVKTHLGRAKRELARRLDLDQEDPE
jgi:RNA polymerase sigma factor (sigma-70 family)